MKGNLILTPENALAFERTMYMLDNSIKELLMVAHNLMPENLVKFGLDTALKEFCESITDSGVLKVSYHTSGINRVQLVGDTEIIVYRIIQELINNTVKHAGATEIIVQLLAHNGKLNITVEDNGKGFDVHTLDMAKGFGWRNIKNRVEHLKGTLQVTSTPGKGTGVTFEFNV